MNARHTLLVTLVASIVVSAAIRPGAATAAAPKAPEISAETWLNSEPVSMKALRGQVVLVEFWTFACWNCKNVEPYIRQWHERYADQGLVVLAVHSPEFSFEADVANVAEYVEDKGIEYVVAIDNDFSTWKAYGNQAWPTLYLIDRNGRLVYRKIGEGDYAVTEAKIQSLLAASPPAAD